MPVLWPKKWAKARFCKPKVGTELTKNGPKIAKKMVKIGRFWPILGYFWGIFEDFSVLWPKAHFFS